ncbi:hypothetical protein ACTNEY_15100 [Fusicatenibacter saccharivorans]|uniref:hypothetical protein n=1 Tax=Fusicatenibacter saccharivorans TaxID=1150298 RepID=UPI003F887E59
MMNAIIKTNIGAMTLGDFEVDMSGENLDLSLFFDVIAVNDTVKHIILHKLFELQMHYVLQFPDEAEEWYDANLVITGKCLHISVDESGKLKTVLLVDYEDAHNPRLWGTAQIEVNLSSHERELRQFIIYSVLKKFC